ncbi:hypothetical protein C8Q79DRAFT_231594 [Trametes meyenii]|nr:hypothetical protein C8Q79DRAFT_231594 [Trametes meyenii]
MWPLASELRAPRSSRRGACAAALPIHRIRKGAGGSGPPPSNSDDSRGSGLDGERDSGSAYADPLLVGTPPGARSWEPPDPLPELSTPWVIRTPRSSSAPPPLQNCEHVPWPATPAPSVRARGGGVPPASCNIRRAMTRGRRRGVRCQLKSGRSNRAVELWAPVYSYSACASRSRRLACGLRPFYLRVRRGKARSTATSTNANVNVPRLPATATTRVR